MNRGLIIKVDSLLPKDIYTVSHIFGKKLNFFLLSICRTAAGNISLFNGHKH